MLDTIKQQVIQDIRGLNEQLDVADPEVAQVLRGMYPEKNLLQSRVPGKETFMRLEYPIRGIAVFYNVYGRRYLLIDGLNLTIDEIDWDFSFDWRLPYIEDGHDDFEDYEEGAIAILFEGAWSIENPGRILDPTPEIYDDFELYLNGSIEDVEGGEVNALPASWDAGFFFVGLPYAFDDFEDYTLGSVTSLGISNSTELADLHNGELLAP